MLMGVPAGIVCPLQLRVSSGAMRQDLAVTPNDKRFASAMTALKYGSCSSSVHDAASGTVRSSARRRAMIWGLARRWKWAIAIDLAVDSVPAISAFGFVPPENFQIGHTGHDQEHCFVL